MESLHPPLVAHPKKTFLGPAPSEEGSHVRRAAPPEVAAHFGFVEQPTGKGLGLSIGRLLGGQGGGGEKCDDDEDFHGFTFWGTSVGLGAM